MWIYFLLFCVIVEKEKKMENKTNCNADKIPFHFIPIEMSVRNFVRRIFKYVKMKPQNEQQINFKTFSSFR